MTTAIYARVSTERQTLAQTIEQQVEHLTAHVHAQGETLRAEDIFRDDGYSGATLNRPGLDRLRDRVKEAALDRVVFASPDRLARNYVHQMVLLEEFEQAGCQVEFLDQPLGQDPQDHLLVQIRGAVAEYERTLIADRMRRGRQMKLQAGLLLPWTVPPYGYRVHPDQPRDPSGVQIEPTEGAIVQELFLRYHQNGETLLGLAKYLAPARYQVASRKSRVGVPPPFTGSYPIPRIQANSMSVVPTPAQRVSGAPPRIRLANRHSQDATPPETWTFVRYPSAREPGRVRSSTSQTGAQQTTRRSQ